jgi:hypothetical protein
MFKRFFVDTSAWAAYYDADDRWHTSAKQAMASLINQRVAFVTTDYVLDETLTLLRYHAGHQAAVTFGEAVRKSQYVTLVRVDEVLWENAWQLFKQYHDKSWAFTDCTSFTLMRHLGIAQVFTFDKHFAQAGFQLWPLTEL